MNNLDYFSLGSLDITMNTCFIQLSLTNQCNLSCWYCYANSNLNKGPYTHFTKDKFEKLLQFIDAQNNKELSVQLLGGEPTLNKNLPHYIETLVNKYPGCEVLMTTNASLPLEYFKDFPWLDGVKAEFSFHSDCIKDPDKWFEKAKYIEDLGNLEIIYLMVENNNIQFIKDIFKKYKNNFSDMKIVPIWQCRDLRSEFSDDYVVHSIPENVLKHLRIYSNDEPQVILKNGQNDIENFKKYTDFKGMFCNCAFYVNEHANVFYCMKYCFEDGKPIMNLLTDEIKRIKKWHVCIFDYCDRDVQFQKASVNHLGKLPKKYLK